MIYHQTEHGVLYHGDCLEILPTFADKSVDMILTSPPYDNLRTYKGFTFNFEGIAKQLYRVLKDGGVCVWIVGDATINGSETGTSFRQALYLKEIGYNLHDTMIYKSMKPPLTHNRYEQEFEYMFVFSKGRPECFNPLMIKTIYAGDNKCMNYGPATDAKNEKGKAIRRRNESKPVAENKIKGNVWEFATGMNGSTTDKIAFEHPAIFPEQLAIDHIKSWSNEGDTVLDCFMGSGTTAKACIRMKRKYIGIDISDEYCEIAAKRIETALDQTDIFRETK